MAEVSGKQYRQEIVILSVDRKVHHEYPLFAEKADLYLKKNATRHHRFEYSLPKKPAIYSVEIDQVKADVPEYSAGLYDFKNNGILHFEKCHVSGRTCFNFIVGEHMEEVRFCLYAGLHGQTDNKELRVGRFCVRCIPLEAGRQIPFDEVRNLTEDTLAGLLSQEDTTKYDALLDIVLKGEPPAEEETARELDRRILRLERARRSALRRMYEFGKEKGFEARFPEKGKALQGKPLRELRVAAIMDAFTLACFQPECSLFEVTPDGWQAEMEAGKPDFLFIESAWKGKDMIWKDKVCPCSEELAALASYCHEKGIPVVFWGKEDPAYTHAFMDAARLADVVFTTDIGSIERYKRELGHDFVYLLHFAAQPKLHHPIETQERKRRFCFAGGYYQRYPKRCRIFDDLAGYFQETLGFDIYARERAEENFVHVFPKRYENLILGGLDIQEIGKAYKRYCFGVNMNSIQESQTMFARRVFELMASNTLVVGNDSRGLNNYFGNLVVCADDRETMEQELKRYLEDPVLADKLRLLALRKVLQNHLYEDRLRFLAEKVFGGRWERQQPMICVYSYVQNQEEADRVARMFAKQTYPKRRLLLISARKLKASPLATITSEEHIRDTEAWEEADFAARFHPEDWYGEKYLLDMALATRYGSFDIIGKAEFYTAEHGTAVRKSVGSSYHLVEKMTDRRSMIRKEQCKLAKDPVIYQEGNILSIDAFQYCENWQEESCAAAADLELSDQGIPLESIEEAAWEIRAMPPGFSSALGNTFLARSRVLVVTNRYPSKEHPYQNRLLHQRIRLYQKQGQVVDVAVIRSDAELAFRSYEGIRIVEGGLDVFDTMLSVSKIDTVCVHGVTWDIWDVLRDVSEEVRVLLWINGREEQSLKTDIFRHAAEKKNIHLIFLSRRIASEAAEQSGESLPEERCSILRLFGASRQLREKEESIFLKEELGLIFPECLPAYEQRTL